LFFTLGAKVEDSSLLKPIETSVKNGKRSRSGSLASVALPLTGGAAGVPTLTNNYIQKTNPSPGISENVISEGEVTEVKAFREVNDVPREDNVIVAPPVPFNNDVENDNTNVLTSETQVVPEESEGIENPPEEADEACVEVTKDESIVVQDEEGSPVEEVEKGDSVSMKETNTDERAEVDNATDGSIESNGLRTIVQSGLNENYATAEDPKVDAGETQNSAVDEVDLTNSEEATTDEVKDATGNEDEAPPPLIIPENNDDSSSTPVDPAEALAKFQQLQEAAAEKQSAMSPDDDQNQTPIPNTLSTTEDETFQQIPNSEKLPEVPEPAS